MSSKIGRGCLQAAALGLIIAGAGPALADGHGDGGHGGGGHGGGGAHFSAGGHSSGGSARAGGGPRFAGGGHYGGGQHFSPAPHYAAPTGRAYGGTRFAGVGTVNHNFVAPHYAAAQHGDWSRGGQRGQWSGDRRSGGRHWDHDGDHERDGWSGAYWRGGYWGSAWWPAAYYGLGFSWFLPVLPGVYATYWYGGIPYYYADNVYYTWDPADDGYVATDPPPVADDGGAGADVGSGAENQAGPAAQIFLYPKNGQSAEQQSEDRHACEQWAASQTAGETSTQAYDDYRRAMIACAEGRGYSAQ